MAVERKPAVDLTNQTTLIRAQAREHSRKLDCFSREKRPGWEQFGNDVAKFGDVA